MANFTDPAILLFHQLRQKWLERDTKYHAEIEKLSVEHKKHHEALIASRQLKLDQLEKDETAEIAQLDGTLSKQLGDLQWQEKNLSKALQSVKDQIFSLSSRQADIEGGIEEVKIKFTAQKVEVQKAAVKSESQLLIDMEVEIARLRAKTEEEKKKMEEETKRLLFTPWTHSSIETQMSPNSSPLDLGPDKTVTTTSSPPRSITGAASGAVSRNGRLTTPSLGSPSPSMNNPLQSAVNEPNIPSKAVIAESSPAIVTTALQAFVPRNSRSAAISNLSPQISPSYSESATRPSIFQQVTSRVSACEPRTLEVAKAKHTSLSLAAHNSNGVLPSHKEAPMCQVDQIPKTRIEFKVKNGVFVSPKEMQDLPIEKICPNSDYWVSTWTTEEELFSKGERTTTQSRIERLESLPVHINQLLRRKHMGERGIVDEKSIRCLDDAIIKLTAAKENGAIQSSPLFWLRRHFIAIIRDRKARNKTFTIKALIQDLNKDNKYLGVTSEEWNEFWNDPDDATDDFEWFPAQLPSGSSSPLSDIELSEDSDYFYYEPSFIAQSSTTATTQLSHRSEVQKTHLITREAQSSKPLSTELKRASSTEYQGVSRPPKRRRPDLLDFETPEKHSAYSSEDEKIILNNPY